MAIQGMKNFANGKLAQSFSIKECLHYVLSLPVSCTAVGCTTIGQLEDDVRFAQQFKPLSPEEMDGLRKRAENIKGPVLEDWKRNIELKVGTIPARVSRHGLAPPRVVSFAVAAAYDRQLVALAGCGKTHGAVILSPSFGRRTPVVRCYCCTRELPGSFAALRMTAFRSFSATCWRSDGHRPLQRAGPVPRTLSTCRAARILSTRAACTLFTV